MNTPTRWHPPTLADAQPDAPPSRCICGRMVPADMLVDVRALPDALRTGHGRGSKAQELADYLCDGCRSRMTRAGRVTADALVQALGAPPALVAKVAALHGGPRATA